MGHCVGALQGACGDIPESWYPRRTRCRKEGWGGRGRALAYLFHLGEVGREI